MPVTGRQGSWFKANPGKVSTGFYLKQKGWGQGSRSDNPESNPEYRKTNKNLKCQANQL
jgi:hypothetical protein